ncbi:MAG: aldo/keto reductase [Desulfobacterales bacterium]|nr:MAG: aldo/keto reductase [Desulfobacterales bacterium]
MVKMYTPDNSPVTFDRRITLGRTGLQVGRLGISSSYGAPAAAFEAAFERGCNYFTWGTFIRGRSSEMQTALRNIVGGGRREALVLALISYAHSAVLTEFFLKKGLKAAGAEYADVLLLGYFPRRPPQRVIDGALHLKAKGLVRFIGLTSHNRKVFPRLHDEGLFDVFHVRYNAVHRGAETETFPFMAGEDRPGVVSFTATCWQQLLKPGKMPPGAPPLTGADCYRFVLSNPAVDVCMMGARNTEQMHANLKVLETGPMRAEELERMRKIGDHIHRR